MKSIFDGWTKKIERCLGNPAGGFCALGWVHYSISGDSSGDIPIEVLHRLGDVGRWISKNIDGAPDDAFGAVVWANNENKLDIEGFKMVDLLVQGHVPEEVSEVANV